MQLTLLHKHSVKAYGLGDTQPLLTYIELYHFHFSQVHMNFIDSVKFKKNVLFHPLGYSQPRGFNQNPHFRILDPLFVSNFPQYTY